MRKTWESLSPAYRNRLERGGITRGAYDRGESLAAARGHRNTPEHPAIAYRQEKQGKYADYLNRRSELERKVWEKKQELFSSATRYKEKRARRAIKEGPVTGRPASMAKMQRFLDMELEEMYFEIDWADDDWDFLFYH